MKKMFLAFFLALIICSFAGAQNEISGIGNVSSLNITQKSGEVLNKEVPLPNWAEGIARTIFRFEGELTFSKFVVLIVIWFVIFILLGQIMKFVPFVKGGISWMLAFLVSLLIGIGGAINSLQIIFFGFFGEFDFIEKTPIGQLIFVVVVILVVFVLISKLLNYFSVKYEFGKAESEGEEAGQGLGILKTVAKVFKEI